MVETKVYCDRCAELITSDRTLLKVASGPERRRREAIDLCTDCLALVVELIDAWGGNCTAPSPRARVARDAPRAPASPAAVANGAS